jgi:hypothetical protein
MEDVQFPPEAGEVKGASVRRSGGIRLRDAETVAATRLDMFGDDTLKEALAGGPPGPDAGEAAAEASPAVPLIDAPVEGATLAMPTLPVIEVAPQSFPPGSADVARDLEPAEIEAPQIGLPEPHTSAPDVSAATAFHAERSPGFSAFDAPERRAETERNGEAASATLYGAGPPMPPGSAEHDSIEDLLVPPQELRVRVSGDAVLNGAGPVDAGAPPASGDLAMPPVHEPVDALPEHDPGPALHGFSPPFPDFSVGAGPLGSSGPPPFREELVPPTPVLDATAPSAPVLDVAAQIAAEADATQQALENLQRMLESNLPDLEPATVQPERPEPMVQPEWAFTPRGGFPPPPRVDGLRIGPHTEAPSLAGTMAPMLPLPVLPEHSSRKSIYLLGFLSGLGLSLMTGIVLYFILYFVINTTS